MMSATPKTKPGFFWLAVALLAALAAVFAVQMWGRAFRPGGNDFTTYLSASRDFWSGANPYAADLPFPFIYPLFLCVALWPLTHVPYAIAVSIWYALTIAALAATTAAVALMRGATRTPWLVVTAIVAVALADVLQNNLVNGQVNGVVLALCALGALAWTRQRRAAAGIAIGAAIAIKITPALLLVWLARRRDWRTMTWAAGAAVVCAIGLPWLAAGSRIWPDYAHYGHTFLSDRLARPVDVVTHYRAFGLVEVVRQLTGSAWAADTWIVAAMVTAVLWIADRPAARPPVNALALYLAASLLISPMSEVHHLILLWPALILLVREPLDGGMSLPRLILLLLVLTVAFNLRQVPFGAFAAVVGTCGLLIGRFP
ncbi:MAG TPA: glycosyltransferase family 87 protein [Vicinamibacterales bacterium]|nr:glycosyltransferase family 87 protein [Vicinamibacterales bacterium]